MESLAASQEHESPAEIQQRHTEQYTMVRGFNQLLSAYDFWVNVWPYPLHLIFDKDKNALLIQGDTTFSWIDIKTTNFASAKKKLEVLLQRIYGDNLREWDMQLSDTESINKVQKLTDEVFRHIKELVKWEQAVWPKAEKVLIDHTSNRTYKAILQKLYADTHIHKEQAWSKKIIDNKELFRLNERGKQYFSSIISDLYKYYQKTKFLWADREKWVFPNNTYLGIRTKLDQNKTLSTEELCSLISHLITSKDITENESISDADKHHAKWLKKLMINQLWAMLYDEQLYNYRTLETLTKDWSSWQESRDQEVCTELGLPLEDIYTETSFKWLSSIGSKELRREKVADMLRARTWIQDDKFDPEAIKKIFAVHLTALEEYFKEQWYDLIINDIELANKFDKKDKQLFISPQDIEEINKSFESYIPKQSISDQSSPLPWANKTSYTRNLDNISYLDNEGKDMVKRAFENNSKKTWWNGEYADIKIRVSYSLHHQATWESIDNTGWYEHMIVNMDSKNECGLSDHNIILDPKKTIVNMIRTKSHIGIDEFFKLVSWGLDTLTWQLIKRKELLESSPADNKRPSKDYIQTQYALRNQIPHEFINLANEGTNDTIGSSTTYIDLDTNPVHKQRIEKAIAHYILQDLFNKWLIQWYFYDNDSIDGLADRIQWWLEGKFSYLHTNRDAIISQALQSKNQNHYRICGWWSNNLVYALRNGTLSGKGTIGIPYNGSIMFFRVTTLAGILADATTMQTPDMSSISVQTAQEIMKFMKKGRGIAWVKWLFTVP